MTDDEAPILEFDPSREAVIEPCMLHPHQDAPECCVLCFFQDAIAAELDRRDHRLIRTLNSEMARHPVYEVDWDSRPVVIAHPRVGAPMAANMLEAAISMGCRRFVACGGCGVLTDLPVGHLIVPTDAVRDEGTSYHYLPPSRTVAPDASVVAEIERTLRGAGVPYVAGKTWTTDAVYRETPAQVARRRDEGCVCVEMEASALFAVARFRGVAIGQILYAGDDLSGVAWDHREWNTQTAVRARLLELAVDAVLGTVGRRRGS
jgi:uridine phosphorylase